jgi:hypothetical protein
MDMGKLLPDVGVESFSEGLRIPADSQTFGMNRQKVSEFCVL